MFLILSERQRFFYSKSSWVSGLFSACFKSIPRTRAAVTFSRQCGGRERGRGPLKEWLKVGDKNKLGERRKLIIHNRQFTWMSTTETEKLRLLSSERKKNTIFWLGKFLLCCHSGHIYLATTEAKNATRTLFVRRSWHQTIQTKLSFQILHTGTCFVHPF